jgi:hypothetical protein
VASGEARRRWCLQDGDEVSALGFRGLGPLPFRRRAEDPGLQKVMSERMVELRSLAQSGSHRFLFFTFTSSLHGTDEMVMAHLKACWARYQQSGVWRRVLGAIWVFGDHERPHLHVAVVLPDDMTIREVRSTWSGGITPHPRPVYDAHGLGAYFGAQRPLNQQKPQPRRRFHGWKPPRLGHFTCLYPSRRRQTFITRTITISTTGSTTGSTTSTTRSSRCSRASGSRRRLGRELGDHAKGGEHHELLPQQQREGAARWGSSRP